MAILPIVIYPDPVLTTRAHEVDDITANERTLAQDMLDTMYDAPGIGLAAPQIGVLKRIIVMDCVKEPDHDPSPMVLVNPQIISASEETSTYEEGCLSIPEQYANITRPAHVKVRWRGLDDKDHQQVFDGLWATCVQHEIDHLDGVLFVHHLSALKRQMVTRKMQKYKRDLQRG